MATFKSAVMSHIPWSFSSLASDLLFFFPTWTRKIEFQEMKYKGKESTLVIIDNREGGGSQLMR